jgi:hypothetical protein
MNIVVGVLRYLTQSIHDDMWCAVGLGRNSPNEFPRLPEPVRMVFIDRMLLKFGINKAPDLKKAKKKIMILIAVVIIFVLLYMLLKVS